jgi:predicted Ser/Thr protein kinase
MSGEEETVLIRTIGRYQAVMELGRGAMGVVYKGYDPAIGRTLALKTIAFGAGDDQAKELRRRLYVEASAAGGLAHPNIVTVYDVVEDGSTTAVAMEFVEGETLQSILSREGPLPPEKAFAIFEQVCAALDYAGTKGIVHRDIKPANILVGIDGRPKIADFGIARLSTSNATQTGMVLGSPSYMSPEQVRGLKLDRRSDLFSAAVVFYEMITGEKPFEATDAATTMYRIAHEPPNLSDRVTELLGPRIGAVLQKALSKDPAERFGTGAELYTALRDAAYGTGTTASGGSAAVAAGASSKLPWQKVGLAAGVVGLVIAGGVTALLMRGGSPAAADSARTGTAPPAAAGEAKPAASPAAAATPVAGGAGAASAAPVVPAARTTDAWLDVEFAGQSFPVTLFADRQQIGHVDGRGPMGLESGTRRIRAVNDAVFLDQDFGAITVNPGERHKVQMPGLASAVVGIKGDVYNGVKEYLDNRPLSGPYPAQVPRIAAGKHKVHVTWAFGPMAGKNLTQTFEAKAGGHFLIRADPEHEQIVVQQVR